MVVQNGVLEYQNQNFQRYAKRIKEIAAKYFGYDFGFSGIDKSVSTFFDAALVYCNALFSVLSETGKTNFF